MKQNESISCTVQNCKYHTKTGDHCSLSHINIGSHETNPTQIECSDCQSFVLR